MGIPCKAANRVITAEISAGFVRISFYSNQCPGTYFAGTTVSPEDPWMKQIARNLLAADEGFLVGKRYLLMDRDTKFSQGFRDILQDTGVKAVRLPPRSPNLNAHLERFWRSLREECLDRMIFFGEDMLRRAVQAYLSHYHGERNHQGLGNRLIEPGNPGPQKPSTESGCCSRCARDCD